MSVPTHNTVTCAQGVDQAYAQWETAYGRAMAALAKKEEKKPTAVIYAKAPPSMPNAEKLERRNAIIELLQDKKLTTKQVGEAVESSPQATYRVLRRMYREGILDRHNEGIGGYGGSRPALWSVKKAKQKGG